MSLTLEPFYNREMASSAVSLGLLTKIKSSYGPFLKEGIEKFVIVRIPDTQEESGYCLLLSKNEIEFKKKTATNSVHVTLDLNTGRINSNLKFKENFGFFSNIVEKALRDVSLQKASFYSVKAA
jgi:5-formaminoimidazole-4-carboxamide-1-beta-D-ribofuranosyl 5'-monophosphate synthetase